MDLRDHDRNFTRITIYRACYVALCAGCGYAVTEMLGMPPLLSVTLTAFAGALCRGYAWRWATALFPLEEEDGQAQIDLNQRSLLQDKAGQISADTQRVGRSHDASTDDPQAQAEAQKESKCPWDAYTREQLMRLAHIRPDLRDELISIITKRDADKFGVWERHT